MERNGIVTLLGAGASHDAGYPIGNALYTQFKELVVEETRRKEEAFKNIQEQIATEEWTSTTDPNVQRINIPLTPPSGYRSKTCDSILEWFERKWETFCKVSNSQRPLAIPRFDQSGSPQISSPVTWGGPSGFPTFSSDVAPVEGEFPDEISEPYLENFFAFYDRILQPSLLPVTHALLDGESPHEIRKRLQDLRKIAVRLAYRYLSAYDRKPPQYLKAILDWPGPSRSGPVVAALNFDVGIEHLAETLKRGWFDGFAFDPFEASPPSGWNFAENPKKLWEAVRKNCAPYVGFENIPDDLLLLIKLHGSLGWYVLEEGSGDIGSREELRHNSSSGFYRVSQKVFWNPALADKVEDVAFGGKGDPATKLDDRVVSRKAGALWLRPYMAYSKAIKTHLDELSLGLYSKLAQSLKSTLWIVTIGYSWSDSHVNDLMFDAIAQGARLVNLSSESKPERALALWIQRFPTTYTHIRDRLFTFGGGAKTNLEDGRAILHTAKEVDLDFSTLASRGLPAEYSLAEFHGQ